MRPTSSSFPPASTRPPATPSAGARPADSHFQLRGRGRQDHARWLVCAGCPCQVLSCNGCLPMYSWSLQALHQVAAQRQAVIVLAWSTFSRAGLPSASRCQCLAVILPSLGRTKASLPLICPENSQSRVSPLPHPACGRCRLTPEAYAHMTAALGGVAPLAVRTLPPSKSLRIEPPSMYPL